MKRRRSVKQKEIKLPFFFTKETIVVVSFLILALILRLIYLSHLKANDPGFYNPSPGTDMLTYDNQAQDILKGKHPVPYYYNPLYSYFLATIYLIFGRDFYIARLANSIFGVLTLLFIFFIAKKVFSEWVALVSLLLSIFCDMFLIHEGLLLLETLSAFLNTLTIFFLFKLEKAQTYKNILFSGLFLALSSLTRANILLFIPFIFIWMYVIMKKKAFLVSPFFVMVALFFIMPATLMNYIATKKFILISTNGPIIFWIGNNEGANGEYQTFPLPERLKKRLEEVGERAYFEDTIRFIKEKPQQFIHLFITKFLLFWGAIEVANNMNYEQMKNYSSLLKLPFFIGFGVIAPLGLFGMLLALRRKEALLLYLFIFSYSTSVILLHVLGRYKIGFLPIFIIFSGFSIVWFYERIMKKEFKKILFFSPLLLSCILFVWCLDIYGKLIYPMSHPKGIHIKTEEGLITRDYRDRWKGDDGSIALSSPNILIKKELYVLDDPNDYKMAALIFDFFHGNPPGILVIDINGNDFDVPLPPGDATYSSIKFPCKWLKKGINTIIIKAKETSLSITSIPIDKEYCFGRSFIRTNGEWKKIKSGEFMIHLELYKKS